MNLTLGTDHSLQMARTGPRPTIIYEVPVPVLVDETATNRGACGSHPSVLAVTVCAECGKPLCATCAQSEEGKSYCSQDAKSIFGTRGPVRVVGKQNHRMDSGDARASESLGGAIRSINRLIAAEVVVLILGEFGLFFSPGGAIFPLSFRPEYALVEGFAVVLLGILIALVAILYLVAGTALTRVKRSGGRLVVTLFAPTITFDLILGLAGYAPLAIISVIFGILVLLFLSGVWHELSETLPAVTTGTKGTQLAVWLRATLVSVAIQLSMIAIVLFVVLY